MRERSYWLECVGPGWHSIVNECLDRIEPLGAHITQVKEKFGGLRIYYHLVTGVTIDELDEIDHFIKLAELEANVTCEECGAFGKLVNCKGWWKTLCEEHAKERAQV
jgi:hypothetical protein